MSRTVMLMTVCKTEAVTVSAVDVDAVRGGGQGHLQGMQRPRGLTRAGSQVHCMHIIPLPKGWLPQQELSQHKCTLPHH